MGARKGSVNSLQELDQGSEYTESDFSEVEAPATESCGSFIRGPTETERTAMSSLRELEEHDHAAIAFQSDADDESSLREPKGHDQDASNIPSDADD